MSATRGLWLKFSMTCAIPGNCIGAERVLMLEPELSEKTIALGIPIVDRKKNDKICPDLAWPRAQTRQATSTRQHSLRPFSFSVKPLYFENGKFHWLLNNDNNGISGLGSQHFLTICCCMFVYGWSILVLRLELLTVSVLSSWVFCSQSSYTARFILLFAFNSSKFYFAQFFTNIHFFSFIVGMPI